MRLVGGRDDDAKAAFDSLIDAARRRLASNDWQATVSLMYDAESLAYRNGMFEEAMRCRKLIPDLMKMKMPKWLTIDGEPHDPTI